MTNQNDLESLLSNIEEKKRGVLSCSDKKKKKLLNEKLKIYLQDGFLIILNNLDNIKEIPKKNYLINFFCKDYFRLSEYSEENKTVKNFISDNSKNILKYIVKSKKKEKELNKKFVEIMYEKQGGLIEKLMVRYNVTKVEKLEKNIYTNVGTLKDNFEKMMENQKNYEEVKDEKSGASNVRKRRQINTQLCEIIKFHGFENILKLYANMDKKSKKTSFEEIIIRNINKHSEEGKEKKTISYDDFIQFEKIYENDPKNKKIFYDKIL